MTEPCEPRYPVPVEVLAEVNSAVRVLEGYGPAVTRALRQLDRVTTVAGRRCGWPRSPTKNGS